MLLYTDVADTVYNIIHMCIMYIVYIGSSSMTTINDIKFNITCQTSRILYKITLR